jgi:MarR family transcriptional regulator, lower aerobic nicotinate degradation pathway regulator
MYENSLIKGKQDFHQRADPMTERFVHRHLPYLLARASHALWRGFEPRLRAAGLNSLEWRVLATLSDSPPLGVGELAREVLAQQPTVTKKLDRLAAQGWVERQADTADARRSRVALTPAGAAHVAPLLAEAQAHEAERLQALGAPDLQRMREALQALVQHFDEQDGPRADERAGR